MDLPFWRGVVCLAEFAACLIAIWISLRHSDLRHMAGIYVVLPGLGICQLCIEVGIQIHGILGRRGLSHLHGYYASQDHWFGYINWEHDAGLYLILLFTFGILPQLMWINALKRWPRVLFGIPYYIALNLAAVLGCAVWLSGWDLGVF